MGVDAFILVTKKRKHTFQDQQKKQSKKLDHRPEPVDFALERVGLEMIHGQGAEESIYSWVSLELNSVASASLLRK